jgi:succinate-semialdehyde dehydrogenase/glutarate-semialdehyde dehydrogenase
VQKGADVRTGGHPVGQTGFFFAPDGVDRTSLDPRVMKRKSPSARSRAIVPFTNFDDAVSSPIGCRTASRHSSYTKSAKTANLIAAAVESAW